MRMFCTKTQLSRYAHLLHQEMQIQLSRLTHLVGSADHLNVVGRIELKQENIVKIFKSKAIKSFEIKENEITYNPVKWQKVPGPQHHSQRGSLLP